jgi:CheY-like chemotaxis protein
MEISGADVSENPYVRDLTISAKAAIRSADLRNVEATLQGAFEDMTKILIVDNDEVLRRILCRGLEDAYDIAETGDFDEALEIALEFRPDCVLLDFIEPRLRGMEFCQKLASLSFTQSIPIFVMTEEQDGKYADLCPGLGAAQYIEKPVNYAQLKISLDKTLRSKRTERRREARIQLRVKVKLRGFDSSGMRFELVSTTNDVSASGFSCGVTATLLKDSIVDVFLVTGGDHFIGRAKVARASQPIVTLEHYGFQFVEKPIEWVIR